MMLRAGRERVERLLADGQKDPGGRVGQGGDRACDIGHALPVIVRAGRPGGAFKRHKGRACYLRRTDGIEAHPGCERVGCIHDMADALGLEIAGQPLGPAEAANPRRQGLRDRRLGAARIGKDRVNARARQRARQPGSFSGSAQKKDAGHG